MIPIFLEYMLSVIWAHAIIVTGCILLAESIFHLDLVRGVDAYLPSHWGFLMGMTFFLQSLVAMTLERRYEPDIFKNFLWMIWYPLIYWTIMALTATFGFYMALFMGRKKLATWVSPDRGFS